MNPHEKPTPAQFNQIRQWLITKGKMTGKQANEAVGNYGQSRKDMTNQMIQWRRNHG